MSANMPWQPMSEAPKPEDWLRTPPGLHSFLLAKFHEPEEGAELELVWAHTASLSATGWFVNSRGFANLHGNASFPLNEATHFIHLSDTLAAAPPSPALSEMEEPAQAETEVAELVALGMWQVALEFGEFTEEEAICASGDDWHQYLPDAEKLIAETRAEGRQS